MLMSTRNAPAKLKYLPYSFRMLSPGDHVLCAVTGEKIMLDDLRYWSIDRQEPYLNADISTQAEIRARVARGLSV